MPYSSTQRHCPILRSAVGQQTTPISATPTLTDSWQPENQILPHVKVKVKWPLERDHAETVLTRDCTQVDSHTSELQFYPGKFHCFMSDLTPEQLRHANQNIWGSNASAGAIIKFVWWQEFPARDSLLRVDWPVPTMISALADVSTEQFRGIAYNDTVVIMVPRVRTHWINS